MGVMHLTQEQAVELGMSVAGSYLALKQRTARWNRENPHDRVSVPEFAGGFAINLVRDTLRALYIQVDKGLDKTNLWLLRTGTPGGRCLLSAGQLSRVARVATDYLKALQR